MTKHFPENKKPLGYVYKEDHNPREPNIGALSPEDANCNVCETSALRCSSTRHPSGSPFHC